MTTPIPDTTTTTTEAPLVVADSRDLLLIIAAISMGIATVALILLVKYLERCLPEDKPVEVNTARKAARVRAVLEKYTRLLKYEVWVGEERVRHAQAREIRASDNAHQNKSVDKTEVQSPSSGDSMNAGTPSNQREALSQEPPSLPVSAESSNHIHASECVPALPASNPPDLVAAGERFSSYHFSSEDEAPQAIASVTKSIIGPQLTSVTANATQVPSDLVRSMTSTSTVWTTDCAVCLTEFSYEEEVRELPCSHIFHSDCIYDWFMKARSAACPLCRQVVNHHGSNLSPTDLTTARAGSGVITNSEPPAGTAGGIDDQRPVLAFTDSNPQTVEV